MSFDPYLNWLGIPPHEQPPNFYRLLGVVLFESGREVIEQAADRQSLRVGAYQSGPQGESVPAVVGRDRHGAILPARSSAESGLRRVFAGQPGPARRVLGRGGPAAAIRPAAIWPRGRHGSDASWQFSPAATDHSRPSAADAAANARRCSAAGADRDADGDFSAAAVGDGNADHDIGAAAGNADAGDRDAIAATGTPDAAGDVATAGFRAGKAARSRARGHARGCPISHCDVPCHNTGPFSWIAAGPFSCGAAVGPARCPTTAAR